MSRPTTVREALIAEAIGDVARLIDRVDALAPSIDGARRALVESGDTLVQRLGTFEVGMVSVAETVKVQAVKHIAQSTNELARQSVEAQKRAMTQAARELFIAEVGPTLQRLTTALQLLVERVDRSQRWWLAHAGTAAFSSLATWGVALYVLHP